MQLTVQLWVSLDTAALLRLITASAHGSFAAALAMPEPALAPPEGGLGKGPAPEPVGGLPSGGGGPPGAGGGARVEEAKRKGG